jgi:hypothetical protein
MLAPLISGGSMRLAGLFFIFFSFFPTLSRAQSYGSAFSLETGKYTLECWTTTLTRELDGSIGHSLSYQKGQDSVSKVDNVTIEKLTFSDERGNVQASLISRTATKRLAGDIYSQTVENSEMDKNAKFQLQIRVVGNVTQFISARTSGKSIDVAGREFSWQKMADERVIVQNYFATEVPGPAGSSHASALCIFVPLN